MNRYSMILEDRTWNRSVEFLHCEYCDGPLLGHRSEKCRTRNEEPYSPNIIKRCGTWVHYIVIYLHKCNILLIYICAQGTKLIYISIIPFKGLVIIKLKKCLLSNAQIKLLPFKYWNYFLLENVW